MRDVSFEVEFAELHIEEVDGRRIDEIPVPIYGDDVLMCDTLQTELVHYTYFVLYLFLTQKGPESKDFPGKHLRGH
jgi:hypothetical protein